MCVGKLRQSKLSAVLPRSRFETIGMDYLAVETVEEMLFGNNKIRSRHLPLVDGKCQKSSATYNDVFQATWTNLARYQGSQAPRLRQVQSSSLDKCFRNQI